VSKFGHTPGGQERVNSDMHSEVLSSKLKDALAASYVTGRFEFWEVVDLEAVDGRPAQG